MFVGGGTRCGQAGGHRGQREIREHCFLLGWALSNRQICIGPRTDISEFEQKLDTRRVRIGGVSVSDMYLIRDTPPL